MTEFAARKQLLEKYQWDKLRIELIHKMNGKSIPIKAERDPATEMIYTKRNVSRET